MKKKVYIESHWIMPMSFLDPMSKLFVYDAIVCYQTSGREMLNLPTAARSVWNDILADMKKKSDKKANTDTFVKPTLAEVKAYCIERKNGIDAERFMSYYASNGWKVGKNPMKDWKAAIRTWEKNKASKVSQNNPTLGVGEVMMGQMRTYGNCKISVPVSAPPRPTPSHEWSYSLNSWVLV